MKIFITSDTHGDLANITEMYHAITSDDTPAGIPHVDKFDYLIHCGDYKRDALELSRRLGLPVVCCFGNCDNIWEADFDILDTPAGSIVVTHGHMEDVNTTHGGLYALAEDQGCSCICYGHTHLPLYEEENGYLVINPGSPSRPLDGTLGSCAVLTADESGFSGELVYYETLLEARKAGSEDAPKPPAKKKTGVGGFLRKIFNYSDGQ